MDTSTTPCRVETNPQVVARAGERREGCPASGDTDSSPWTLPDWLTAGAGYLRHKGKSGVPAPLPSAAPDSSLPLRGAPGPALQPTSGCGVRQCGPGPQLPGDAGSGRPPGIQAHRPRRRQPTFLPSFLRAGTRPAGGRAGGGGPAGPGPGSGPGRRAGVTGLRLHSSRPCLPAARSPGPPARCRAPFPGNSGSGSRPGHSPGPRSFQRRPSSAARPAPAPQARDPLTPRRKCGRLPSRLTAGARHSLRPAPSRRPPPAQSAPGPRAEPGGGSMLIAPPDRPRPPPHGSPAHAEE